MLENLNLLYNNEIEQAVLGEILKDETLYNEIEQYPESLFYATKHQELFKVMKILKKENKPLDIISVCDYIKKNTANLTVTYVIQLSDSVPSTIFFSNHLESLLEYMNKRAIFHTVTKIDFTQDVNVISDELSVLLNSILSEKSESETTSEYLCRFIDELYNPKEEESIKLGLNKIDEETNGIKSGQLITIAAYTGMGKSIVTAQIMFNMLRRNKKIALFSLEMSRKEIITKFVSNGCGIEAEKINKNILSVQEKDNITKFVSSFLFGKYFEIYEFVDDIHKIVKAIKKEKLKNNIDVVFLDLINRVDDKQNKTNNRAEFLGSLTRKLKLLAGQLNIPIIITAQINRAVEQRQDKAPTLADIKESGGIAEDSDLVLGLYRDKRLEDAHYRNQLERDGKLDYTSKDATKNPECIEIHILKGRNVAASKKAFKWVPKFQRIENIL